MKTKLLITLLFLTFLSQAQVDDFITGLTNEPNRLIIDNNVIYVVGVSVPGEIVEIDLSNPTPSANTLFTASASFEIGGIIKNGDTMYFSSINSSTGESSIVSFDVNSPLTTNTLVSGLGFVPALDLYNDEIYFIDENLSGGGIALKKINVTVSNPPVNTVVSGFTNPQDVEFNGSVLYVGDRDAGGGIGIIYAVDVSLGTPVLNSFITNVNVRGVYVYNDFLYFSDAGVIKKAEFSNPSNITTEATDNDGNPEFLRDVVISATTLYMPQESSGKIVSKEDLTLSDNDFRNQLSDLSIYINEDTIYVNGLTNGTHSLTIYGLTGSKLLSSTVNPSENSVNIVRLSDGIYLLHINNNQTFKFIK